MNAPLIGPASAISLAMPEPSMPSPLEAPPGGIKALDTARPRRLRSIETAARRDRSRASGAAADTEQLCGQFEPDRVRAPAREGVEPIVRRNPPIEHRDSAQYGCSTALLGEVERVLRPPR